MTSVEEKLKAYRKKKEETTVSERRKDTIFYLLSLQWIKELASPEPQQHHQQEEAEGTQLKNNKTINSSIEKETLKSRNKVELEDENLHSDGEESQPFVEQQDEGYMSWYYLFVKFLLWGVLQAIFVEFEFGSVFFIATGFYLMLTNMGTRNQDEPSAYSVFNPNCESIDGTLTAEQFENEIRHKNMK